MKVVMAWMTQIVGHNRGQMETIVDFAVYSPRCPPRVEDGHYILPRCRSSHQSFLESTAPLRVSHLHALRLVAELLHKGRMETGSSLSIRNWSVLISPGPHGIVDSPPAPPAVLKLQVRPFVIIHMYPIDKGIL
jgi:hypothetical protein